jgi:hypothetical protein
LKLSGGYRKKPINYYFEVKIDKSGLNILYFKVNSRALIPKKVNSFSQNAPTDIFNLNIKGTDNLALSLKIYYFLAPYKENKCYFNECGFYI